MPIDYVNCDVLLFLNKRVYKCVGVVVPAEPRAMSDAGRKTAVAQNFGQLCNLAGIFGIGAGRRYDKRLFITAFTWENEREENLTVVNVDAATWPS